MTHLARVAGYVDYTSDGTSRFIPEIWSGRLQVKYYLATCLAEITNNDWTGEIKDVGDTVIIRSIPTVTTAAYQKGQELVPQYPESTPLTLFIDKGRYFNVVVDDVDAYQQNINLMNRFTDDAAKNMKIDIENDVFDNIAASASAYNVGNTAGRISGDFLLGATTAPVQLSKSNILEYIVDCGTVLTENNVPDEGRWMVLPAWAAGLIKKSDLKDASLAGDQQSIMRNGRLGLIDTFMLYKSNNLDAISDTVGGSTVNCWDIYFGTKDAVTFASQITKVQNITTEKTFGQIIRGLNVYGYKVVKPEALGVLYVRK